MIKNMIYPAQLSTQSFGKMRVNVTTDIGFRPIEGATVSISYADNPQVILETTTTNSVGQTGAIELSSPPIEYSMEPSAEQPYSNYVVKVEAPGYETLLVDGTEILPDVTAIQNASLVKMAEEATAESFVIPPHTLYGDYPPKIAEDEVKTVEETGEIVLSRVVIPEFVIVHDGPPNSKANNYYVRFRDYIKNVASSEIYATWPVNTIQANIFAILSFTINRVYTEWYRNKGYNFTITSSTAYDHKWIPGRNYYDNISLEVDSLFNNYLSRPNITQPILTQYCDGNRVQCPGWMTQWGSKYLGDQGYQSMEIIRYFYGDNMYLNTAPEVSGIPSSFPGQNLSIGSTGNNVRTIQNQLNVIADSFPAIPKVVADGVFGQQTADSVKIFQEVFDLPPNGIVDFPTWYRISEIYVATSRIAELV